jgi:hypothetical protein
MRLNINLATQPYQDARSFALRWGALLGFLVLLAAGLTYAVVNHWQTYRHLSAAVEREKQILSDYDNKQQQDLAILNRPDNQDVRQQSEFLNNLIKRKQVSWTRIFSDLEKIMPARLRVLAMEPSVAEDQILVKMVVGGDSRERAGELVRKMEQSGTFRFAQVVSEKSQERGNQQDPLQFEITAEYNPSAPALAQAPIINQPQQGGQ